MEEDFDWLSSNTDSLKKVLSEIIDFEFLDIIKDMEDDNQKRAVVYDMIRRRIKDLKFELYGFDLNLLDCLLNHVPWYEEGKTKESFSIEMRDYIYARDNYMCHLCHSSWNGLICHHIHPQGNITEDNLITLCLKCHEIIHRLLRNRGYPFTIPNERGYR